MIDKDIAHADALMAEVQAAGYEWPYSTWGHGQGKPSGGGRLCQSCDAPGQTVMFTEEVA